ncbi:hypothetical protein BDV98DRAFT_350815 [Pterulicium gracile]|uniref:Uncharacterized protein n=1 Tax=Pterulicium gracile TaxID=1884261 RepID=A0A5C3QQL8_9AGAR|nr:hypothetical protein BDV98DRAFT_350815 [Pterula gracilis]
MRWFGFVGCGLALSDRVDFRFSFWFCLVHGSVLLYIYYQRLVVEGCTCIRTQCLICAHRNINGSLYAQRRLCFSSCNHGLGVRATVLLRCSCSPARATIR